MRGRHTRTWGWLALTLGLTPGFFFLEHWGLEGIPAAEGCSGAGAVAPPSSVQIWRPAGTDREDIATDGFFLLGAYGVLDPSPLVSTTKVSVTTLEGAEVAGKLSTIAGAEQSYLAWQADAPLTVGTKLKVVVEGAIYLGAPIVPDEATFEVTGEPASLGAGNLSFESWLDYRHGVGAPVSCTATALSNCVSTTRVISVFGAEDELPAVYAKWHADADLHGFTLWELSVTPRDPAAGLPAQLQPQTQVVVDPDAPPQLNALVFAKAAPSYCLTIRVKDLRSGAVKTTEQCTAPGTPTTISRDYALSSCDAPPSAELTEAWCEATKSTSPVCQPSQPLPDEPSEPMPDEPPSPEPQPQPTQPTSNAAQSSSRTSSSCQVALVGASAAGGAFSGFGAVVGLLSLSSRRRRRA